jgi:serine-threonine kinase receptor-associated protein
MEGFSTHKIIPHHVHKMPFTLKTKRRLLHPSGTKFVAGGSDLWVRVLTLRQEKNLESLPKATTVPFVAPRYAPDGTQNASGSEG